MLGRNRNHNQLEHFQKQGQELSHHCCASSTPMCHCSRCLSRSLPHQGYMALMGCIQLLLCCPLGPSLHSRGCSIHRKQDPCQSCLRLGRFRHLSCRSMPTTLCNLSLYRSLLNLRHMAPLPSSLDQQAQCHFHHFHLLHLHSQLLQFQPKRSRTSAHRKYRLQSAQLQVLRIQIRPSLDPKSF